jgi:hypothetical protein
MENKWKNNIHVIEYKLRMYLDQKIRIFYSRNITTNLQYICF